MSAKNAVDKSPVRQLVRQCGYFDTATGKQCQHAGIRLRLRLPLGGHCIRYLCSHHSDWEQDHG